MRSIYLGAAALLLTACSSVPKLTYVNAADLRENREGLISFTLPRSQILIVPSKAAGGGRPDVTSVPTDDYPNRKRVFIRGEHSFLQDTDYANVTRLDGTDVISSISFETVSHTEDIIKFVSSAVPVVAALLADSGTGASTTVIDPDAVEGDGAALSGFPGWKYRLRYTGATEVDGSMSFVDFMNSRSVSSDVFPTSRCLDASLELIEPVKVAGSPDRYNVYAYGLKIADPSRVMPVRVPVKGSIKMHTSCGFDLATTTSSTAVDYASLNALVKAVGDLKAAKKK